MMRRILLALALLLAVPLAAADLYVSPSGSGTTCSFASPCAAYYAVTTKANPGDTVWFRGGTYTFTGSTRLLIQRSGTEAQPIIWRNYNNEHAYMDCNFDHTGLLGGGMCSGVVNSGLHDVWIWGLDFGNSSTEARISDNVATMQEGVKFGVTRGRLINNFFRDGIDAVLMITADTAYGMTMYGNYAQYNGRVGTSVRGYGHSYYLRGGIDMGETGRNYFYDNLGLRAFDVGTQDYATASTETLRYMTHDGNVEAASGHACCVSAWPATGNTYTWYLGAGGAAAGACDGSTKVWRDAVFTNNWAYGDSGIVVGGSKGSCNVTMTGNLFAVTGGFSFTTNNTFPPLTFTGNTLNTVCATGSACGGTPAGTFNQANYPSNTWGLPSTTQRMYQPNDYEAGRGFVAVYNPTDAANVTIDPAQMGCYAGENVRIFNWQDNNPWDSTPIATQTGCAPISVPTTCTGSCVITQPGFTTDGSTPFPKPADLGPRFVVYVMYPDWSAGATPTPTNTASPTHTFTPTRTPTFTPSMTPSNTVTPTHTLTPTGTLTQTPTFTSTRTPTTTPTPGVQSTSFSVANCVPGVVAPMVLTADAGAYGGTYASSPTTNTGTLTCTFNINTAGDYYGWGNVYGADSTHDSFFVSLDGEADATHIFDTSEGTWPCTGPQACESDPPIPVRGEWLWNRINDRSATCGLCSGNFTTRIFSLTAGSHTVAFRQRDPDTRIAWVIFTQNPDYIPPDFVPTPTPTPNQDCPPGYCKRKIQCNGKAQFRCVPCTSGRIPNPCPWN